MLLCLQLNLCWVYLRPSKGDPPAAADDGTSCRATRCIIFSSESQSHIEIFLNLRELFVTTTTNKYNFRVLHDPAVSQQNELGLDFSPAALYLPADA